MTKLHISPQLSLPIDAVTQTFAILAKRRTGKTYTASVMAEEMVAARLPFVVLDPTNAWWGLRSSADGKHDGLPVIIIGGAHGDVPLEATAGKVIADLVVEHPGFYVIDLSATASNAEQDRFATDFAERLYRRKEQNRTPLHLFIDEADSFAPQRPLPGQQRMLGAFEALVRRGGIRGIGVTLITQRPAVINKNVLTQTECLIILQMTAPQDQKAVDDWVQLNGTKEQRDTMMASLASLKRGEAWIWSPAWLEVFQRIHIRERDTFNSSATPKAGEKAVEPQRLAEVDLNQLKDKIAATLERAKADDPHELKRQIVELKRKLNEQPDAAKIEIQRIEVPIFKNGEIDRLDALARAMSETGRSLAEQAPALLAAGQQIANAIALAIDAQSKIPLTSASIPARTSPARLLPRTLTTSAPRGIAPKTDHSQAFQAEERLPKAERAILTVLAQYPDGRSINQVAILAGYAVGTGGFNNAIGSLRSSGYIHGGRDRLQITEDGLAALGPIDPLPTGRELIEYWRRKLGKAELAAFDVLVEIYPDEIDRDALATQAGYTPDTGGINNAIGRLRTLELAMGRSRLRANDTLFE